MVIFETCDYLHLSIYPEGQIEYPVELVNFLERALLLLPDVTKKPCGLFLDYTHRHTNTHTCISHIHTHECHTHYTDTCKHVTHKHVTRMHTYVTHIVMEIHVNTHVPQHMSTSIMIRTPFASCLSGRLAHSGMLPSFNDGSAAINECHRSP